MPEFQNGQQPDPKAGESRRARERKLSQTQELKAITLDPSASKESRELARQVQEMRDNSKALGIPTDVLDQFADNALADEKEATKERLSGDPEPGGK